MTRSYYLFAALTVSLAASAASAAAPPQSARVSRATMDRLLVEYRACGLPLPPKGSRLVRRTFVSVSTGKREESYCLGIVVRNEGKEAEVWSWPYRVLWPRSTLAPVSRTPADLRGGRWMNQCHEVVFAVQCHSLGWTDLARDLLRGTADCVAVLRWEAWLSWEKELNNRMSDWRDIARHLKRLLAVETWLDTEERRTLVKDLIAATGTRRPTGSIGRMIDDLIDEDGERSGENTPSNRLARLGFDAVPALIEALDDSRITRMTCFAGFRSPPHRLRVQDLASQLLEVISGVKGRGGLLTRAEATKWWLKAKPIGEEAYAASRVISKKGGWLDRHQLEILAARYPRHLPAAYRKVLKDPRASDEGRAFADAIASSELPREEKVVLLRAGARHKNLTHRFGALRQLRHLDLATARKGLARTFLAFPTKLADFDTDDNGIPEVRFVSVVATWDDDLVWKAFEQAVRRAEVHLRMEMLHELAESKDVPRQQRRRVLTILAAFLSDRETRKEKNGRAGCDYSVLSVQNLAASEMAELLDVELPVDPERNAKDWAKMRASVRKVWDRERLAPAKTDPK